MKAREVRLMDSEAEASMYWTARANLYPLLMTILKRSTIEDVTVPRNRLPQMVRAVQEISASTGVPLGASGHAGDGNLHPSVLFFEVSQELEQKAKIAVDQMIRAGLEMGGTISGEHGIGIHKAEYLGWELGDVQIELMKRIKSAFDPKNIMNPGKLWVEGGVGVC
jgi:glycolate oxidase